MKDGRAGPRLAVADLWPLLQGTAAATAAWVLATHIVHHHEPFFAPTAALVSLNTSFGERGLNALRVLLGVVLGIGVAEVTLLALGGGYGSLALATFVALTIARAMGGARILLAQAGIGAILTVALANGKFGYQRLTDALIGTGVALVFSQLLFSPQPLRLLRRVETNALAAMSAALGMAAQALAGEKSLAERAVGNQRDLRDRLSEVARMRRASTRVARHSLVWRGQVAPLVRENEDTGHLDLLGGSCLLLTRTSLAANDEDQRLLAPCMREFSETLADLARNPGDQAARQRAVDRSLQILRKMRSIQRAPDPDLVAAISVARVAVTDLMRFVGVDAEEALAVTRQREHKQQHPELPNPGVAPRARPRRLLRWFR